MQSTGDNMAFKISSSATIAGPSHVTGEEGGDRYSWRENQELICHAKVLRLHPRGASHSCGEIRVAF